MNPNSSLHHQQLIVMPLLLLWMTIVVMNPSKVLAKESASQGLVANFTTTFATATSSKQPYATLIVTLDARNSTVANDNSITDYHWQVSTGEVFSGNRVTLKLMQSGAYTVDLTITDKHSHTASSRQIIKVKQTQTDSTCPSSDTSCIDVGYTFEITVTDETGTTLGKQSIQVQQHRQCQPPDSCLDSANETEIPVAMAFLNFVGLKPFYRVGETLQLDLVPIFYPPGTPQTVDLWVTLETPEHSVYFLRDNPSQPFSVAPQPFKTAISNRGQYHLLEYTIPAGIGGNYQFYAVYSQPGGDLSHLAATQLRSNQAFAMTLLSDY